jgi:hypothetical protein
MKTTGEHFFSSTYFSAQGIGRGHWIWISVIPSPYLVAVPSSFTFITTLLEERRLPQPLSTHLSLVDMESRKIFFRLERNTTTDTKNYLKKAGGL